MPITLAFVIAHPVRLTFGDLALAIAHPVRLTFEILGGILAVLAIVALINYLRQRNHQKKVDAEGLVLYATVLASAPIGGIAKYVDMQKIDLRIQEPNKAPREVTLRTRTAPGQRVTTNTMLIIVVDPADPNRIYPASAEAAKRVTLTGSKQEKKLMQAQLKHPRRFHQRTRTGYMPPPDKLR